MFKASSTKFTHASRHREKASCRGSKLSRASRPSAEHSRALSSVILPTLLTQAVTAASLTLSHSGRWHDSAMAGFRSISPMTKKGLPGKYILFAILMKHLQVLMIQESRGWRRLASWLQDTLKIGQDNCWLTVSRKGAGEFRRIPFLKLIKFSFEPS